mgnify:CR=1 FL=1
MNALTRFDTQALSRALVGFDTMFDDLERRFANSINSNYPPHNIIKFDDDTYAIELAVAGFTKDEITVEVADNQLSIKGEHEDAQPEGVQYLHRGLGARNFVRVFPLAEHIVVKGAQITNGILRVNLERVLPEEKKPRLIDIVEA